MVLWSRTKRSVAGATKFCAEFARCVKTARLKPASIWHLDEMFVTLRDKLYLLWREVAEHEAELDVPVKKRRNKAAAKRYFRNVLGSNRRRLLTRIVTLEPNR